MFKAKWDEIGKREYRTGVDRGMLYPQKNGAYPKGYSWSGLTTVTQRPSGAEDNAQWADNIKYLNIKSAEDFGITIECLTYPPEFDECNGIAQFTPGVSLAQQRRNTFGFSWRTQIGNDTEGSDAGYEIHLVYQCSAAPSEISNTTINDSPEASTLSFEVNTTAVTIPGTDEEGRSFKPTAHVTIDSRFLNPDQLAKFESILYGTAEEGTSGEEGYVPGVEPRLPLPEEFSTIFAAG